MINLLGGLKPERRVTRAAGGPESARMIAAVFALSRSSPSPRAVMRLGGALLRRGE